MSPAQPLIALGLAIMAACGGGARLTMWQNRTFDLVILVAPDRRLLVDVETCRSDASTSISDAWSCLAEQRLQWRDEHQSQDRADESVDRGARRRAL